MAGYKDTAELADECENQYCILKARRETAERQEQERQQREQYRRLGEEYNRLRQASTEEECRDLAGQFRAMNGYKNTTELAADCDAKSRRLKERREERERAERYQRLFEEAKRASTEEDWQKLAVQCRGMGGYKDTAELANKCDAKYRELKEQREEEERQKRKSNGVGSDTCPTYIVWSIISTLLCCTPLGIVAIVFSVMCKSDIAAGRWSSAAKNSKLAFYCNISCLGLFCMIFIIGFIGAIISH